MENQKSCFIISLDFELDWGVRATKPLEDYKDNLLGARSVIPVLLNIFHEYKIYTTWAIVGLLFFESRDEMLKNLPVKKPKYLNRNLSPYKYINNIGKDETEDPFHFAPSLIKMIASCHNQEIASHTFSHYYCLEEGSDIDSFKADLEASIKVAKKYNQTIKSLVLPRNQFNIEYKSVCKELGIKCYRGNERAWIYRGGYKPPEPLLKRAIRLDDHYFNIFGHNCYSIDSIDRELPYNIPSSRFLRPYYNKLKFLEPFRLRRILDDLTYAAKNRLIYHLC